MGFTAICVDEVIGGGTDDWVLESRNCIIETSS
jgi:hypothetical protein